MQKFYIVIIAVLCSAIYGLSQHISKEDMLALTPNWKGERFESGRPKVPDELLKRLKLVTLEEAWAVLRNENYKYNYEDGWQTINPDSVLVGRAVTATFMPGRPDLQKVIDDRGLTKEGRQKAQNTWPIEILTKGDVYVADQFGAHNNGPTVGDNLGNSIYSKTGNGVVYYGALRDINGLKELGGFTSFFKSYHPSHHQNSITGELNTTLVGLNTPTRIGNATVLPGDAVLGRDGGVIFIPPHLLEKVVKTSEIVRLRDMFSHQRLKEGKYTTGQIDTRWAADIEKDFSQWLNAHIDKLPVPKEQIQEILKQRTW